MKRKDFQRLFHDSGLWEVKIRVNGSEIMNLTSGRQFSCSKEDSHLAKELLEFTLSQVDGLTYSVTQPARDTIESGCILSPAPERTVPHRPESVYPPDPGQS